MCACNTTGYAIKRTNFDSNGIPFLIDNSANCYICADKSFFVDLHLFFPLEKEVLGSIGAVGDGAIPEGFGNMHLVWKDNNRADHAHIVQDAFYIPNSPVNLV